MPDSTTKPSNLPDWVGPAATAGGAVLGRYLSQNAANNAVPPELRQLLAMGVQRSAYQNPLFQAVNQGVYSMLPSFAREGTSLSGTLGNQPPAVPSGGGMSPLAAGATGAGLAALLGALGRGGSGGGGNLSPIVNALKKLFGGGGNKPGEFYGPSYGDLDYGPSYGDLDYGPDYGSLDYGPFLNYGGFTGTPNDPSGGSGVGPGMQQYYSGGWWGDVDPTEE